MTSSRMIPAWNAPTVGKEVVILHEHRYEGHQGIVLELDPDNLEALVWLRRWKQVGVVTRVSTHCLGLIEDYSERS